MLVKYTGPSDHRKLSKSDFERLGVEDQKAMNFNNGEVVEVDDALGEVLLTHDLLSGEFTESSQDTAEPREASGSDTKKGAANKQGAADQTTDVDAGDTAGTSTSTSGTTGRRTSTTRTR